MWHIDFQEIITAFLVLFAVIDITGSIPVIMSLNASGSQVKAGQASILSLLLIVVFLFVGEGMLKLFNTDLESFAIAGSLILFALAVEMTFNIKIFRNDGPPGYSTIIPMVFPLIAGAGTLTTALSMRAQYGILNILIAIVLNMVIVYLVIRYVNLVERLIGKGVIYILRKFFGVILIAMAVKLFITNLTLLLK